MHPVLLRLKLGAGHFELHSFGVLVAAGCAAAILFALREARRRGIDEDTMRDLCFWTLIASLVGARVVYLASAGRGLWDECLDAIHAGGLGPTFAACGKPLRIWQGGLVFYGGVMAGAATMWWYARRQNVSVRHVADVLAPSLALGHAVGRLGCFLAGCCFGKPAAGPLGIAFPDGSIALQDHVARGLLPLHAEHTPPLHPTQLYEAIGELALFFALLRLAPRLRRAGDATLLWLASYSALRFVLEMFRGDVVRSFLTTVETPSLNRLLGLPATEPSLLSTSQAIALAVIAGSAAVVILRRLRPASDPAADPRSSSSPDPAASPGSPVAPTGDR